MRKIIALIVTLLAAGPALAQQFPTTFPPNTVYGRLGVTAGPGQAISLANIALWGTNPDGADIYNANAGKVGIGIGAVTAPVDTLDVVGSMTTRRSIATDVGGTLKVGNGAYQWKLIGNQNVGGDLYLRNPAGGDVLSFPQTGSCVGVQVTLTTCPSFGLILGSAAGNAGLRVQGGGFVAGQGPYFYMTAGATDVLRLGTDCAIVSSPCVTDIFARGPGVATGRQFRFYDWAGVRVVSTASANPSIVVGGAFLAQTESTNVGVGANAIVGHSIVQSAVSFPTAITALIDVTTGGANVSAWGGFYECDMNVASECATFEATIGNTSGSDGTAPLAASINGMTAPFISAVKATCGGSISHSLATTYNCSVGFWGKYYQNGGGKQFRYGMYLDEGYTTSAGTGILVNATSALSPLVSAEFRHNGAGTGVIIKDLNSAGTPTNKALSIQDQTAAAVWYVQNNGFMVASNGAQLNSVSTFTLTDPSGFQQGIASNSSPALTATRTLTLNMQNANRTLSMAGDFTVGASLTFTGTGGSTLNIGTGGTLGTAAYVNTGTSGGTVPLLNGSGIVWTNAATFGVATGAVGMTVNGGNGNGQGSYLSFQEASVAQFIVGTHSAIFGGVDTDHTPVLFGVGNIDIYPASTQRHRFWSSGGVSIGAVGSDPAIGWVSASNGFQFGTTTVVSLPACNAGNRGKKMFVSDANATWTAGIGAVVAGGGANTVPVGCDGTNWRIG